MMLAIGKRLQISKRREEKRFRKDKSNEIRVNRKG